MRCNICTQTITLLCLTAVVFADAQLGICSVSQDSVATLIKALSAEDARVRASAADSLRELGPAAKAALPFLRDSLRDPSETVRRSARDALTAMGVQAVPFLVEALAFEQVEPRVLAAEALGGMIPKRIIIPAVPALIRALRDQDSEVRIAAVVALVGLRSRIVIHALMEVVSNDTNRHVRERAVMALGNAGPRAAIAVHAIVEFMRAEATDNPMVRYFDFTPKALALIGASAVPELVKILRDSGNRYSVRSSAIEALRLMVQQNRTRRNEVPEVVAAIPVLIEVLRGKDGQLAIEAAEVLADIGPGARTAISALTTWLKDEDWRKRVAAAYALHRIEPENRRVTSLLLAGLKHKDNSIRRSSVYYIGRLKLRGPSVTRALTDALKDSDLQVRQSADNALRGLRSHKE